MGTTITVARVEDDGSVTFGHVGDSRAYLLRDDDLEQLTDDHSLVAELVRRGELSAEAAEVHPQRSVITRALGTDPDVDVDAFSVDGEPGDLFLICSDGLSDMVDGDDDRGDPARAPGDLDDAAARARPRGQPRGRRRQHHGVLFELVAGARRTVGEPDERDARIRRRRPTRRTRSTRRTACAAAAGRPAVDTIVAAADSLGAAERKPRAPQAGLGRRLLALTVIVALDRRHRRARLVGARALTALSLRNRELLYLIGVGVLTGLGFASVYIARQSLVNWGSLSYALFFFGLYLAAHVVARVTVPNADPYLLPMAGLLTAVGVTEIYRLGADDAFKQGLWIVIGVGALRASRSRLRRDYRVLEQYKYLFGIGAIALLFLPRVPASARRSTARASGCTSARSGSSPASSRRSS